MNQYRILEILDHENAAQYKRAKAIVQDGHPPDYETLYATFSRIGSEVCVAAVEQPEIEKPKDPEPEPQPTHGGS